VVEVREDEAEEENHMEVDNGNNGANRSAKKKQSDNGAGNSSEGKEKQKEQESDGPSHNAKSQDEKQSEQLDTVEHGGVDVPTAMQNKVLNFLSDTLMHAGNCCLHLNQQTDEGSRDFNCLHDLENLLSSSAA
jgi:hypothetical protein